MRFFHKTNIDFVGNRAKFFMLSLVVIAAGIIGAVAVGPELGIDFIGGTEVTVEYVNDPGTSEIRSTLDLGNFEGSEVKTVQGKNQYLIRVKETGDANEQLVNLLNEKYPDSQFSSASSEVITPRIGQEMQSQALYAIIFAVVAILLYVAFRFEFVFGLGAIVALVHDVLIALTFIIIVNSFGLLNLEINQAVLAALLTVVGFSINDTVIIFDRIRENSERHKGKSRADIFNESINETLSRTVNTLLTAVLALIPIVLFGGPSLEGFAFTMLIGFLVGTYSSIFIASSFVIWYSGKSTKAKTA